MYSIKGAMIHLIMYVPIYKSEIYDIPMMSILLPPYISIDIRAYSKVYMIYIYTGWRKPIGCLKLQVIFRTRATQYTALLWKMTCEDMASYGSLQSSIPTCIIMYLFYEGCDEMQNQVCDYLCNHIHIL